jgi:hypothetical protein
MIDNLTPEAKAALDNFPNARPLIEGLTLIEEKDAGFEKKEALKALVRDALMSEFGQTGRDKVDEINTLPLAQQVLWDAIDLMTLPKGAKMLRKVRPESEDAPHKDTAETKSKVKAILPTDEQANRLMPSMKELRIQLQAISRSTENTSPSIQHEVVGIARIYQRMKEDSLDLVLAKNAPETGAVLEGISIKIEKAERTVQPDTSIQFQGDYYKELGPILAKEDFLRNDTKRLYELVMEWLENHS